MYFIAVLKMEKFTPCLKPPTTEMNTSSVFRRGANILGIYIYTSSISLNTW